jgi:hypothetical protein
VHRTPDVSEFSAKPPTTAVIANDCPANIPESEVICTTPLFCGPLFGLFPGPHAASEARAITDEARTILACIIKTLVLLLLEAARTALGAMAESPSTRHRLLFFCVVERPFDTMICTTMFLRDGC